MAIINSSGGFSLDNFIDNYRSVSPSMNNILVETGDRVKDVGLNTLSKISVPKSLTELTDKILNELPVTYRIGNVNAGWDIANFISGLYGVISGAVTPVSPNMNILYNTIEKVLSSALDAIGLGDLNKARNILYDNQSGGGLINDLIKKSTKTGIKYELKDSKIKDWMKKDNKLPIEDWSALQTKSLGLFDASKWFLTMEVPESSRKYGIPNPPYNNCTYIDQDARLENIKIEKDKIKIIERKNADLSNLEQQRSSELSEYNNLINNLSTENSPDSDVSDIYKNLNEEITNINEKYNNIRSDIESAYESELNNGVDEVKYYSNTSVDYSATGFIPTVGDITYDYFNGNYENIQAASGLGIDIPMSKFDRYSFSVNIVNDQHNTVFNYLKQYANAMFPGYRKVLPYKHCVTIVRLFILNKQKHIINRYSLLCIPSIGVLPVNGATRSGTIDISIGIQFNIVGELNPGEKFSF